MTPVCDYCFGELIWGDRLDLRLRGDGIYTTELGGTEQEIAARAHYIVRNAWLCEGCHAIAPVPKTTVLCLN